MSVTDLVHTLEFLASPDATRRIMGITKQEKCGLLVGTFPFEIVEVDFERKLKAL